MDKRSSYRYGLPSLCLSPGIKPSVGVGEDTAHTGRGANTAQAIASRAFVQNRY